MQDDKISQPAINTIRTKSTEAAQATKSGHGEPPSPAAPVARRKRWLFAILIVLIASGALPVIFFLFRSQLEYHGRYKGLLIALCAVAFGVFLVRRLVLGMEEEDKLEEEQRDANPATVSPSEANLARREMNPIMPPPEKGET